MDKLEYKSYYGSIEYSKEDNCLFGKVIGMSKDLIRHTEFAYAFRNSLPYCNDSRKQRNKYQFLYYSFN